MALVAVLIIAQFFRPTLNEGDREGANSIVKTINVPPQVQAILGKACYDCHSNRTDYPWYTNVQPLGWWLQSHVNEGKRHLNFSEWASYDLKRQIHKLEEVREMIAADEMPLSSYKPLHAEARISEEEKKNLIDWARASEQHLRAGGSNGVSRAQ